MTTMPVSVTQDGRRVTDDYGAVRRRLLIQAVANVPGFSDRLAEATRTLNLLSGIAMTGALSAADVGMSPARPKPS